MPAANKSNKIYIELSERSLDLYKQYATPPPIKSTIDVETRRRPRSQAMVLKTELSTFSMSSSFLGGEPQTTTPVISNTSEFRPPELRRFCDASSDYAAFFQLDHLAANPFRYMTENNLNVNLNFLNVGYGGAKEPSEKSIRLYEQFCKQ